jgi:hypothetical protein
VLVTPTSRGALEQSLVIRDHVGQSALVCEVIALRLHASAHELVGSQTLFKAVSDSHCYRVAAPMHRDVAILGRFKLAFAEIALLVSFNGAGFGPRHVASAAHHYQ